MARTFTPEEIAEMKAFLQAHPPDPAYDEEDELFENFRRRNSKPAAYGIFWKTWASCPHPTTEPPKHDADRTVLFSCKN